jgi:long-chain acyl-CoA synthetase
MKSSRDLYERFETSADTDRVLVRSTTEPMEISGHDLRDRVGRAIKRLRREGIAAGERVLLPEREAVSLLEGILAVWGCDAVAIPAGAPLPAAEMSRLREILSPHIVLGKRGDELHAERLASREGSAPARPLAVIKLSSGSTGRPRGIGVTAAQLLCDTEQILRGMGIGAEDWNIAAIPLSHSYGMGSILMPLVAQGNPILVTAPLPGPLSVALSAEEPAFFPGIPTLFEIFCRREGPSFEPRGLKSCISAGALLRSSTARAFRRRHGLPVRAFYGSSETGGITVDASSRGDAAETEEGCVGTPLPGVEIGLEGAEGRVVVRGGSVASGYLAEAGEASDGEFVDGAFRTGDTGRIDGEGRLRLTGRISQLVNVSGRKVNPREVEEILLALPGVSDAAVLGIPDESRGEALLACVVAEGEVTRERLMSYLRERLADYKLPRRVVFLPELPRTGRGKLDRRHMLRRAGIRP